MFLELASTLVWCKDVERSREEGLVSKLLVVGMAVILVVGIVAVNTANADQTWCVYSGAPVGNDCPEGDVITFCVLCTSQWPAGGECPAPTVWIVKGVDCKYTNVAQNGNCGDCPNGVEYTHAGGANCQSDTCTMEINPPTAVGGPSMGIGLKLRASPNPSSQPLAIQYAVPVSEDIQLIVADATGSVKATLVSGNATRGTHVFVWDGKGKEGSRLPAGIYYLRLEAGGASRTVRTTRLQ